jgi:hypothetical protein
MTSQKDAGTTLTGFVTVSESPTPRQCSNCEHYNGGNCDGKHVMNDPELRTRRNEDGTVKVEANSYCWFYEPR